MILLPLLLDSRAWPVDKISRALAQDDHPTRGERTELFRARIDPASPALATVPIVAESRSGIIDPEAMRVATATAIAHVAQTGRLIDSGAEDVAARARRFAPDLWATEARTLPGTTAWDIVTMLTVTALVPVRQANHRLGADPADRFLEPDLAQRLERKLAALEADDHDVIARAMPIPLLAHYAHQQAATPGIDSRAVDTSGHTRIAWARRLSSDLAHLRLRLAQIGHPPMAVIDLRAEAQAPT